jgi:hypothetical protein
MRIGRITVGLLIGLLVLTTGAWGQMIGNPGFEDELTGLDQGNWLNWGGSERLDWQVHEGSYSLCIKGAWCGVDWAGADQRVSLTAADEYELSFYHYWDGGFSASSPVLEIDWRDSSDNVLSTEYITIDLQGDESVWSQVGPISLVPVAGAVKAEIRFNFEQIAWDGAYYIDDVAMEAVIPELTGDFFGCSNGQIVDPSGSDFLIRGLGISGWLMAEGYMWKINRGLHMNTSCQLDKRIKEVLGETDADAFWQAYRENFLSDDDLDFLVSMGLNTVRLPFNYRMFSPEDQEGVFDEDGFALMDAAIQKFKAKGIYVILDMHAVPGGASSVVSGDPERTFWVDMGGYWQEFGKACLWEYDEDYYNLTGRTPESNQARAAAIWQAIAAHYADEEAIIGYELINEPSLPDPEQINMMRNTFIQISEAIRAVDQNHILFVEGDLFAEDINGLLPAWDDNMAIAFHTYWKPNGISQIQAYLDARDQYNIPIICSEAGENSNPWAWEFIQLLEDHNIGWTWWGWKKSEGYATGFSAPVSDDQQYVIDNLWESDVDPVRFLDGLMDIANNMRSVNCDYKRGYFEALFDPMGTFGTTPQPFSTHIIPCVINCVDYDIGNQGIAYYDTCYKNEAYQGIDGNQGLTYRSDGVDILPCSDGCGYKVAYAEAGEWLKYTVQIPTRDRYYVSVRVASTVDDGQIEVLLNGKSLNTVTVPNTGGWDSWQTVTLGRYRLNRGTRTFEIRVINSGVDLSQLIVD